MSTAPGHEPLFEQASRDVLGYLHAHVPLAFWAVTRVENGRQTYLSVQDSAYGLSAGGSHPWDASFCIHMASGAAPHVAPDAQAVPLYAAAGVHRLIDIGAYAGAAIEDADGGLFGAICGLDPQVQPEELAQVEPLLLLLSRLLTVALVADRQRRALDLQVLQARLRADMDELTGVHSRSAWIRLLADESEIYRQLADPTAVVVIDLDELKDVNDGQGHAAGDALLQRAARAIASAVRGDDPVARLGGDEFGVLLRSCSQEAAADRAQHIRDALEAAGVSASVGVAAALPDADLAAAQEAADEAMYAEKRARRAAARG
ncbi:MAG: GGDEF domain-containing protein [Frankiales bacterium]|nr:MAG: GGDEF domain-containing protein [Frankiales bacterium]